MRNFTGVKKQKSKNGQVHRFTPKDFRFIKVSKGEKTLEIDNPTDYPLIGMGTQGAVFKLSDEKCVKIYEDPVQAKMEAEALMAGQQLSSFPKIYESGENYVVMEYLQGVSLKEYLKNATYIPKSIVKGLLTILQEFKKAGFTMVDAPLRHIIVLKNKKLKAIDHVNAFKRDHPVPLKLLRDLKIILLKDAFLSQAKKLEPDTVREWENYFRRNRFDFRTALINSGGSGESVKVSHTDAQNLIGKGHQGAVFRISETKCVKIYSKTNHAEQEQEVLLSGKELPFIPKVYETGENYVVMEFLDGPDLNTFLKKQTKLSEGITSQLLKMLTQMKKFGFKQIDAPLRHIIITKNGFKMVDHVYAFVREQELPLELFLNLHERGFLGTFLEHVKVMDPETYKTWTKIPIPLDGKGTAAT
ncbi:AarF/UbiB family protein [Neobacillus mesonae]|uniref:AarF/UbiB family protein n=1 Tax=Neobacillus mesonae TaxID=1193713 RepID=UPI00257400D5|nr:AarF/UbiB family protein [Neobacillus mesonae]MED4205056.1 AarF/UbiB family protein [Neobacillus mesonae]